MYFDVYVISQFIDDLQLCCTTVRYAIYWYLYLWEWRVIRVSRILITFISFSLVRMAWVDWFVIPLEGFCLTKLRLKRRCRSEYGNSFSYFCRKLAQSYSHRQEYWHNILSNNGCVWNYYIVQSLDGNMNIGCWVKEETFYWDFC